MKNFSKSLLGVRVGDYALHELIDAALVSVRDRTPPFTFACANPHSLVTARHDPEFRHALQECSAVVADGIGVTMAARMFGLDVGERITGADFFLAMMAQLNRRGGRAFFLGSRSEVLDRILSRARREYPNVHVDVLSPPYGEWSEAENARILATIRDARPDVLWVGMTAPKQEKWVCRNRAALETPVIGSIGAVFDFYAGTVQRAPDLVCKLGLEWLYRLVREPQRLWRRTLISAPVFLWFVMREQFGGRHI
jgi:N-acetylglucosaminyldiphosphoundecaprenol N-acetyl-beta-D-mannosaminyltransferase